MASRFATVSNDEILAVNEATSPTNIYIHTLLRLPLTGLKFNSKYIQNYSKYIQTCFV